MIPHALPYFAKSAIAWQSITAVLLLFAYATNAQGFTINPMSYTLEPSGDASRQTLRIENTFRYAVAIEIEVSRRSMDEAGQVSHMPAEEDFLIFPPQTRLEPGATQAIRVQYIGDPNLTETRAYTVAARQVPVRAPESDSASVQVVFNMGTAAYVRPRGARAEIDPVELQPADDEEFLRAVIHNRGNGHLNLQEARWIVRNGDGVEQQLDRETLQALLQNPVIYPGQSRHVLLPKDILNDRSAVSLSIRTDSRG